MTTEHKIGKYHPEGYLIVKPGSKGLPRLGDSMAVYLIGSNLCGIVFVVIWCMADEK